MHIVEKGWLTSVLSFHCCVWLRLCWKAFLENTTPHQQHWANSVQKSLRQPLVHDWLATPETLMILNHDAVEAHSCVDIVAKFTHEQNTTINQSTAGRVDPRVFANCLQVSYTSELQAVDKDPRVKTPYSWLINSCVLLISEFRYYVKPPSLEIQREIHARVNKNTLKRLGYTTPCEVSAPKCSKRPL